MVMSVYVRLTYSGGELLSAEDAEPHEGGDAGEKKSADEGRLAQQREQSRDGGAETSGVRDAILHEDVGERHADDRQQEQEKARQGHARRLRKLKSVIARFVGVLAGEGLRYHRGRKGNQMVGDLRGRGFRHAKSL